MDRTKPTLVSKRKAWLIGFLNFCLLGFSVWAYISSEQSFITAASVNISLSDLLMLITAGLCGPVPGMGAFLAAIDDFFKSKS